MSYIVWFIKRRVSAKKMKETLVTERSGDGSMIS